LKSALNIRPGLTFLFVGRIVEAKGVGQLLNAWAKHIVVHQGDSLVIVGDGPLLESYRRKFEDVNSIKFIGGVDYDTVHQYYAISDVFVMPTLEDNWSLVVPEAMACGMPIACSIYNGCYPELVQEGVNGMMFDPLKEGTLLAALGHFHGADLVSMGRESIRIEKDFSPDEVGQRIFDACVSIEPLKTPVLQGTGGSEG